MKYLRILLACCRYFWRLPSGRPPVAALTDALIDANSRGVRVKFKAKHHEMVKITQLLRSTIENIRAHGFATHAILWNCCLYLHLAAHDHSLLLLEVSTQRDDWGRRFAVRHLSLLMYETAEDMQSLLGKTFRNALKQLGILDRFDAKLRLARKPLDEFWRDHQMTLKHIRITTAAHRDHDGLAALTTIQSVDIHAHLDMGLTFGGILNDLVGTLQQIINESSRIMPPEIQTK